MNKEFSLRYRDVVNTAPCKLKLHTLYSTVAIFHVHNHEIQRGLILSKLLDSIITVQNINGHDVQYRAKNKYINASHKMY